MKAYFPKVLAVLLKHFLCTNDLWKGFKHSWTHSLIWNYSVNVVCNYNLVCELLVNYQLWKLQWGFTLCRLLFVWHNQWYDSIASVCLSVALELPYNFLHMSSHSILLNWGDLWVNFRSLLQMGPGCECRECAPHLLSTCIYTRRKPGPAEKEREMVGSGSQSGWWRNQSCGMDGRQ